MAGQRHVVVHRGRGAEQGLARGSEVNRCKLKPGAAASIKCTSDIHSSAPNHIILTTAPRPSSSLVRKPRPCFARLELGDNIKMVLGPSAQYFLIHLPSATTVSFTVSTRPLHALSTSTKTFRSALSTFPILTLIKHVLRVLLVSFALLINLTKVEDVLRSPIANAYAEIWPILGPFGGFVKLLSEKTDWWVLVLISLGITYTCMRKDYVGTSASFLLGISGKRSNRRAEESLVVLQGLGIQTSTSSRYFFTSATTTFIPTTQIQDIVIHEAFKGLEVRFYLAVIVEGATEVVVVFPVGLSLARLMHECMEADSRLQTLLPRRDILEEVWRGSRKCLYSGIR